MAWIGFAADIDLALVRPLQPAMVISSVDLPDPDGPIEPHRLAARDSQRYAAQHMHPRRPASQAQFDIAQFHRGLGLFAPWRDA